MNISRAHRYAKVIRAETKRARFDPLTVVALVHHESSWRPGLVSRDGEDIGLGQIRARFFGKCRSDPSPVKAPGKGCRAVRARLQIGTYNLKRVVTALSLWRKTCRKRTGRAMLRNTLMGYGGLSRPKQNQWCGLARRRGRWVRQSTPWVVERIIKRRRLLVRRLAVCRGRCTAYRSVQRRLTRLRSSRR